MTSINWWPLTFVGCWLSVCACTNTSLVGTHRDHYGELHRHAADNDTVCFSRAAEVWRYCGSRPNEQVAAIYGPTGAMTISGDGCYFAWYGCPAHGSQSDGHVITGKFSRDTWAEQHENAANDEKACLSRALAQWRYCGSNGNHPVTSIFRPTGALRTAGAGCWIHVRKCLEHPTVPLLFYDSWGAANLHTETQWNLYIRPTL